MISSVLHITGQLPITPPTARDVTGSYLMSQVASPVKFLGRFGVCFRALASIIFPWKSMALVPKLGTGTGTRAVEKRHQALSWLAVDQKQRGVNECCGANCTDCVLLAMTCKSVNDLSMHAINWKLFYFQTEYVDQSVYYVHAVRFHAACPMLLWWIISKRDMWQNCKKQWGFCCKKKKITALWLLMNN